MSSDNLLTNEFLWLECLPKYRIIGFAVSSEFKSQPLHRFDELNFVPV